MSVDVLGVHGVGNFTGKVPADAAIDLARQWAAALGVGSVATYEALWAYPRLAVELLITVGSPLAMPDRIFPRLQPAPIDNQGDRPPGARRWVNIPDPADLVALPRQLGTRFQRVASDLEAPAGPLFTHKASAYLSTEVLRGIVAQHLGSPSQH